MDCPRCGHANIAGRRNCSLCQYPLQQGAFSSPSLNQVSPLPESQVGVRRPTADTLVQPTDPHAFRALQAASPFAQQNAPQEDTQEAQLEWDMAELDQTIAKGKTPFAIGREEPENTAKHTAPGMIPFSEKKPAALEDFLDERTLSNRPQRAGHLTDEHTVQRPPSSHPLPQSTDENTAYRAHPATAPPTTDENMAYRTQTTAPPQDLQKTTPKPQRSLEHTFANALTDEHTVLEEDAYDEHASHHSNPNKGLTVPANLPAVPSLMASTVEEAAFSPPPPPQSPLRNSKQQLAAPSHPAEQEHHSKRDNLMPTPPPLYAATEKQDVSFFRKEAPTFKDDELRPLTNADLSSTNAPSESTSSTPRTGTLPKPRLKQDFVFAQQVILPPLWRRLLSGLLDLSLLLGFAFLLTRLFGPPISKTPPAGLHPLDMLVFALEHYNPHLFFAATAFAASSVLYHLFGLLFFRKTLGKWLLRLEVVDRSGNPLSLLGALVRAMAFLPSFFLGLVGIFWILIDSEFRGLHDRISGSIVVQSR